MNTSCSSPSLGTHNVSFPDLAETVLGIAGILGGEEIEGMDRTVEHITLCLDTRFVEFADVGQYLIAERFTEVDIRIGRRHTGIVGRA